MAVFESIIVYTLCWMAIYLMAKNRYTHLLHLKVRNGNAIVSAAETVRKMPYWLIILSSLIVCYYTYFSMAPEDMMASDRQNYVTNFTGGRESPSLGLTAVMGAVIMVGGDFHMLIYVSVFVSMFVTFCAYRFSKDATICFTICLDNINSIKAMLCICFLYISHCAYYSRYKVEKGNFYLGINAPCYAVSSNRIHNSSYLHTDTIL